MSIYSTKDILLEYLEGNKRENYNILFEKELINDENSVIPRVKILITIFMRKNMLNRFWINCGYDSSKINIKRLINNYYEVYNYLN
jgi:hypothetical protein